MAMFGVTKLGDHDIYIGHNWLKIHNPSIDWASRQVTFDRCPSQCHQSNWISRPDENTADTYLRRMTLEWMEGEWKEQMIQELSDMSPEEWKEIKERTPEWIHEYADVFSEQMFTELPKRRSYDHAIDLKPDASLGDCKVYPLNPNEEAALMEFLEENLKTGRIRPSKSPIASPFFFIKKKDGKLRPVQDSRKLNEATIKNRYPLPLIQE